MLMSKLIAAIHGILTGQTEPSWPDRFDAWIFQRAPEIKVLKKEYRAGPFPRWNCWVKDPLLARSLANEIELFLQPHSESRPSLWMIAHSNGAVIALLAATRLIERGFRIDGLILTGAACESDIESNGILEWQGRGMLGVAIAYSSREDKVLEAMVSDPGAPRSGGLRRIGRWLWGKLLWPYGSLGRTGWTLEGRPFCTETSGLSTIQTRWFKGGHGTYFTRENSERIFRQILQDVQGNVERRDKCRITNDQ
jgi:pimeloyl-ACP methyl ester carboxylesterase